MSVSWPQLLPAVLLAVAVLVGPGALILRATGLGWLTAVLAAPAVSVGVIVVAGLAVDLVGATWTPVTGILSVALVITLGLGGGLAVARAARARQPAAESPPPSEAAPLRATVLVAAVCLAAAYLVLAGAAASPLAIPQMPDVVFHLGAVEWMVRHGSASVLDVYQYAQLDGPLAYPGGFHAVVAALAPFTGLPVTATWHALLIVTVGVVWPFGVMLLARVVLGRGTGVLVAAGLLTLVFTSFPVRFLAWGPLWSNLLANALLPAVLAGAVCGVAPSALVAHRGFGASRVRAIAYAVLGLLVLLSTQPNAVATGTVLGCAVVASSLPHWRAMVGRRWADRWLRLPWFLALVAGVVVLSTRFIPPKMYLINAHVLAPWDLALAEWVAVFDGTWPQVWALLALLVVGAVRLGRDPARRWVTVSVLAFSVIFLALYAVNGPIVRQLTWLWWNDHYRVRAALVLPTLLCATAGTVAVGGWLARLLSAERRAPWRESLAALVAAAVVAVLGGGIPTHRWVVDETYREDGPDYSWVTPQEYAALQQLSGFVPAGSVVAANPYRGGMFFYVASGVEVFYPTENSLMLPDRKLIGTSLTLVESLTAVCSAAARHRVDYVLTGGSMHIWGVLDHTAEYAGVDATARNPHFEVVAQSGPYTLRRVPECTPGAPSASGMPDGEFVGPQLSGAAWPAPSARSAAAR